MKFMKLILIMIATVNAAARTSNTEIGLKVLINLNSDSINQHWMESRV